MKRADFLISVILIERTSTGVDLHMSLKPVSRGTSSSTPVVPEDPLEHRENLGSRINSNVWGVYATLYLDGLSR
jgi:hypothetical protein